MERALKFDPGNIDLIAQKQRILAQQIQVTTTRLDRLKAAQKQVEAQFKSGKIGEEQYRAFQREIITTESKLKSLEGSLNKTNNALKKQSTTLGQLKKDYKESFDEANNSAGNTFDRMQAVGGSLLAIGTAATIGLGSAVKTTMDFDTQMSKVQAVTGATGTELNKLRDLAKSMGETTKFSATQAAEAMTYLSMAGFKATETMDALPHVLNLAAAGALDLGQAADISSNIMSAFNIKATDMARVSDVLAKAATSSNTTVEQLGDAMKYLGPIANSLGWSLEECAAAIGIFSDAGIQGEMAGAAFSTSLQRLSSPTGEMKKAMDQLGISFFNSNGTMKSLSEIVNHLKDRMSGLTDQQKQATISTLFGAEASKHWITLLSDGAKNIGNFTGELEKSKGAADQMASTMSDNLKGSMDSLKSSFEGAQISIGEALAPAIQKIAEFITKLINLFNSLSPAMQSNIAVTGAVVTAILLLVGPVLLLTAAFPALAAAASFFGVTVGTLIGVVGGVVLAIAALIAAIVAIVTNWDAISAALMAGWEALKAAAIAVFTAIGQFLSTVWAGVSSAAVSAWSGITAALSAVWNGLLSLASAVWSGISNAVSSPMQALSSVLVAIWNGIRGALTAVWNGLKSVSTSVWNGIRSVITSVVNGIRSVITSVFNAIRTVVTSIWNGIRSATSSAWNGIKNTISNGIRSAYNAIKGYVSSFLNAGKGLMKALANGIKSGISSAISAVKNGMAKIRSYLPFSPAKVGPLSDLDKSGESFFPTFASKMNRGLAPMLDTIDSGLRRAGNLATDELTMSATPAGGAVAPVININNPTVRNDDDIRQIAQQVSEVMYRQQLRNQRFVRGGG